MYFARQGASADSPVGCRGPVSDRWAESGAGACRSCGRSRVWRSRASFRTCGPIWPRRRSRWRRFRSPPEFRTRFWKPWRTACRWWPRHGRRRGFRAAVADWWIREIHAEELAAKVIVLLRDPALANRKGLDRPAASSRGLQLGQLTQIRLLELLENPVTSEFRKLKPTQCVTPLSTISAVSRLVEVELLYLVQRSPES